MKEKLQALVTSREEEAAKNNDRGPVVTSHVSDTTLNSVKYYDLWFKVTSQVLFP